MRTVFGLCLLVALGTPAFAQVAPAATHSDQQTCLTWLSLASRFGPESEQDTIDQQYLQLNSAVLARVDLSEEQKLADANSATEAYDKWVLDHFNGNDETKAAMLAEVLAKAKECEALLPADPDGETAPTQ